jgi:1-phosphofructokinase/tagatose 6-phosphate kinase
VIVTVTMNAAVDRTLTVPNFQLGHRHRASQGLTLAGGKGISVARSLKLLEVPVVATGLAGGRSGARIVEELTAEGILNDFVRIADESRTTTAVLDPTGNTFTEINEWGPQVQEEELTVLRGKLHYLARGTDLVVFAGSLPRGVAEEFYADAIRDLNRLGVQCVLQAAGEPFRLGLEAEPFLVAQTQPEAEALVGQEFRDDQDFVQALDDLADLGARNVLISGETGCFALLRQKRSVHRLHAVGPRVEPVWTPGADDVLLAAFLAAHLDGRTPEDALRGAVASAAVSTLEVGAGRFEPREATRLAPAIVVTPAEALARDG